MTGDLRGVVFDYASTNFPMMELGQFGAGLAAQEWDRAGEIDRLSGVLEGLRPGAEQIAEDMERIEATEGPLSAPENMPVTINTIRRGILYKKLSEDAVVPARIREMWGNEQGWSAIWGDDGKVDAMGSGFLLTAFINGLDKGGFPKKQTKAILRAQIEEVLRAECDDRTSYVAVGALRHLYRVMKYAELHSPESRMAQIRRGDKLLVAVGLELTDF